MRRKLNKKKYILKWIPMYYFFPEMLSPIYTVMDGIETLIQVGVSL